MKLRIAVIGAAGLMGRPVVQELVKAGNDVTVLLRREVQKKALPASVKIVVGDMKNADDLKRLLAGQDILHLNLSVAQNEKPNDWHSETDGLQQLLPIAKESGIKRISYLSSLVQQYQGMNGFDWWAFRIKENSLKLIRESTIPYYIFSPSTFMEAIMAQYKQGKRILVVGKSYHKQYFIAAEDYARQVLQAFDLPGEASSEYVIQGLQGFTTEEAVNIFVKNYKKEKLNIIHMPMGLIKFMGNFVQQANYGYHILESLNRYPEKFQAGDTWEELGKPTTTLTDFAGKF